MTHAPNPHTWGPTYEHKGTSYRECSDPECSGHQEWICMLDRWSDTFETPSPRAVAEGPAVKDALPTPGNERS